MKDGRVHRPGPFRVVIGGILVRVEYGDELPVAPVLVPAALDGLRGRVGRQVAPVENTPDTK